MSVFIAEARLDVKAAAMRLKRAVEEDFRTNPETRREFERWYLEKYGKPYKWKKGLVHK